MSAYKEWDEHCDPNQVVRLYNNVTGTCVYSFCQEHQFEYVLPNLAFNLDYFRMVRDYVVKLTKELGKQPRAWLPMHLCLNKVYVSQSSLAEDLFGLEVADEEKP